MAGSEIWAEDKTGRKASPPIRDAATLILYRRHGGKLQVLMGERHGASAFLPNRFVFPGGRLDLTDYRLRPIPSLNPVSQARLARSRRTGPRKALGLALAAIRETFEESGLRLAVPGAAAACPSDSWVSFCEGGLLPDPSHLLYVCRAITPPDRPRRFDARFFAAPAEAAEGALRPSPELDKLDWITPEEAQALLLPNITKYVLANLEGWLDPARAGDPAQPVPFRYVRRGEWKLDWE
ncbi:NUDIX domain-containing protein [uncultured Ferrovibrio sp.]|jgi:8-oxo-dGTP pyrophosphatase MutT (NUDIX family)|uniref:NUDIX hydrolase n=1 Tax=uncultured Ferrovibrio sp. TaxID=1576913 RepID=UPI002628066A|nr:NUDIX domain-containing protein [uncultured Ferrovibrio sp.]